MRFERTRAGRPTEVTWALERRAAGRHLESHPWSILRVARVGRSVWGPVAGTFVAVLLAVALRLPFFGDLVFPDEGGYLLVAHQWHTGGTFSYGDLFLDRPPLLLLLYRTADMLGGVSPLRLLACLFVVTMTAGAGWAGWMVGAGRGSRWAAFVTAALMSSPLLGTHEVDGELLAAPLTLLGCTFLLVALQRARRRSTQLIWTGLAGLTGTAAVLVKQNFVDALVFALVALAASAVAGRLSWSRALQLVGALLLGVLLPLGVVVVWAVSSGSGIDRLWYATYAFRSDAARVIITHSLSAPEARLHGLVAAATVSGIVPLTVVYFVTQRRRLREGHPMALATGAMLITAVPGVALGTSFWSHYLIQFAPAVALASAVMADESQPAALRWPRVTVIAVIASTLMSTTASLTSGYPSRAQDTAVETWLSAAAEPSDSLFVAYGHADILYKTGLRPAYPYLWSLQLRTLDPELTLLRHDLSGSDAPVWFLQWEPLNSWQIDATGRLGATVLANYRQVTTLCGVKVYLHKGMARPVPASTDLCGR